MWMMCKVLTCGPNLLNVCYFYYLLVIIMHVRFTEEAGQLSSISHTDFAFQMDRKQSDNWQPKSSTQLLPDFRQFLSFNKLHLNLFHKGEKQSQHSGVDAGGIFKWSSVSLFTSTGARKISYILLGGSIHRVNRSTVLRQSGQIYLCKLFFKSDEQGVDTFDTSDCVSLNDHLDLYGEHNFLGFITKVLRLDAEHNLLVYCDPLWRANYKVPVGRCFAQVLQNDKIIHTIQIADLCQFGGQLAIPCAAGYSIDLQWDEKVKSVTKTRSVESMLKDINLWIGQPLATPYGRVQIISDLTNTTQINTFTGQTMLANNQVMGALFGYAVIDGFVTAPGLPYLSPEYNQTDFVQLIRLQISRSKHQASHSYITSDWFIEAKASEYFSGYGHSITTVKFDGQYSMGIVVGAPYTSSSAVNDEVNYHDKLQHKNTKLKWNATVGGTIPSNRGRIYLYCLPTRQEQQNYELFKSDFVDAPDEATNFGYAITNMNDLDGDGNEDIAIGAPSLSQAPSKTGGKIYIIKLLSQCRIDRVPLQILHGPPDANDFGAYLPAKSVDLDFNFNPDLVVPFNQLYQSMPNSNVQIYTKRPVLLAECHYTLPPWLTIRRIMIDDLIPVQLIVYFLDPVNKFTKVNNLNKLFSRHEANRLLHQISSDWNATDPSKHRFTLHEDIKTSFDYEQSNLIVEFQIKAKQNVEDMHGVETERDGVHIAYRFLQPCPADSTVIDKFNSCAGDNSIKRPIIEWSNCMTKLPLVKYICYPHSKCQSDVALELESVQFETLLKAPPPVTNTTDPWKIKKTKHSLIRTIPIQYANKNMSRQQTLIKIYNYGPTLAHGTYLVIEFNGNLRFSRLDYVGKSPENGTILQSVSLDVTANETWATCYLGTLAQSVMSSPPSSTTVTNTDGVNSQGVHFSPVHTFLLATYYDKFMPTENGDLELGASVMVSLLPGTEDPNLLGNSMSFNFMIVHQPKVRISYGPTQDISSRMDNRTKPTERLPGKNQRVLVSELGPKMENTLQIEYLGPNNSLKDVGIRLLVPIELNPADKEGSYPLYLFYMFNEIRAPNNSPADEIETSDGDEDSHFGWVDTRPQITAMGQPGASDISKVGKCSILRADRVVNPRGMIGMHLNKIHTRYRRNTPTVGDKTKKLSHKETLNSSNLHGYVDSVGTTKSKGIAITQLRRIQKEIIQCGRIGYRLQAPLCTEILCTVHELVKNRPVLVKITGWLWARTLFAKHISDIDLVTTLTVDRGVTPRGVRPAKTDIGVFYHTQTFFFPQIRPKLLHQIPMWPIIVGVVLGVIFLYFIIILLYLLGFFRRRRPPAGKAKFTKGGAEETYEIQRQNESHNTLNSAPIDGTVPPKVQSNKRIKKKYRKDISIVHPADLLQKEGSEEQKLIPDSNT